MSKKVSHMVKAFRTHVLEKGLAPDEEAARKMVDGDWTRGYAFLKKDGQQPVRLMSYSKPDERFVKGREVEALGWTFCFAALEQAVNEITLWA